MFIFSAGEVFVFRVSLLLPSWGWECLHALTHRMINFPLSVQLSENIFALDVSPGHEEFSEKYFTHRCLQARAAEMFADPRGRDGQTLNRVPGSRLEKNVTQFSQMVNQQHLES